VELDFQGLVRTVCHSIAPRVNSLCPTCMHVSECTWRHRASAECHARPPKCEHTSTLMVGSGTHHRCRLLDLRVRNLLVSTGLTFHLGLRGKFVAGLTGSTGSSNPHSMIESAPKKRCLQIGTVARRGKRRIRTFALPDGGVLVAGDRIADAGMVRSCGPSLRRQARRAGLTRGRVRQSAAGSDTNRARRR